MHRLGAITPAQAVQQALSATQNVNPKDASGFLSPSNPGWASGAYSLDSANIYLDPVCGGQPAPNLNLFSTASGLALGTTSAGVGILGGAGVISGVAAGIATAAIAGVGAIIALVAVIFAHHAAAVKRDIAAECSLVPAANNALQVIIQGVQSGQISPTDAIGALQALPDQFLKAGGPAINYSPYCNSVCEKLVTLRAICFYWISKFQDLATQQTAQGPLTSSVQSAIASTGLPSWLLWAAGGFLVYEFVQ